MGHPIRAWNSRNSLALKGLLPLIILYFMSWLKQVTVWLNDRGPSQLSVAIIWYCFIECVPWGLWINNVKYFVIKLYVNGKYLRNNWIIKTCNNSYASSSCLTRANSSLVIEPSPSLNFCNFSLDAEKSGLIGVGGIWKPRIQNWKISSN